MSDDQSRAVPESFIAVHADERGRSRLRLTDLRERHELCDDLAHALVERVRELQHALGVDEAGVVARVAQGLADPAAGLLPGEADWVRTRLLELLASTW